MIATYRLFIMLHYSQFELFLIISISHPVFTQYVVNLTKTMELNILTRENV